MRVILRGRRSTWSSSSVTFVAGAVLGEVQVQVSLFVAGAVLGEIWNDSRYFSIQNARGEREE